MKLIPPAEAARRARAAVGYSGLELRHISEKTGITVGTLRNITSRTAPKGGGLERLRAIADACGVPRAFMEEGWAALDAPTNVDARLGELEETVRRQANERQELLAEMGTVAARAVAQALESGELPTDEEDSSTGSDQAAG